MKARQILTLATLATILLLAIPTTQSKPHNLRTDHSTLYRLFHAPGQDLFVRGYEGEGQRPENQHVSYA